MIRHPVLPPISSPKSTVAEASSAAEGEQYSTRRERRSLGQGQRARGASLGNLETSPERARALLLGTPVRPAIAVNNNIVPVMPTIHEDPAMEGSPQSPRQLLQALQPGLAVPSPVSPGPSPRARAPLGAGHRRLGASDSLLMGGRSAAAGSDPAFLSVTHSPNRLRALSPIGLGEPAALSRKHSRGNSVDSEEVAGGSGASTPRADGLVLPPAASPKAFGDVPKPNLSIDELARPKHKAVLLSRKTVDSDPHFTSKWSPHEKN
jgi:hypothetical protein